MNVRKLSLSRRSVTLAAAAWVGVVSLAIGAHAALNMRSLDASRATETTQSIDVAGNRSSRIALVIGNGHYPDASAPLTQSINDARGLRMPARTT